jgi:hypothetical protein
MSARDDQLTRLLKALRAAGVDPVTLGGSGLDKRPFIIHLTVRTRAELEAAQRVLAIAGIGDEWRLKIIQGLE